MEKVKEAKEIQDESLYYYTIPGFNLQFEDGKDRQFGIMFEILNMMDATGEDEFKNAPFLVSASIVLDKPSKKYLEADTYSKEALLYDVYQYMGGVPIDHVLANEINGGLKEISAMFSCEEAVKVKKATKYGTIAAQKGPDYEFEYLQFVTFEAAKKYMDFLINHRVEALGFIGFFLDRPINMIGDTGWKTLEGQAHKK